MFKLYPIPTPMALETLLFLLFVCGISINSVLEHFKIALQKIVSVFLMLKKGLARGTGTSNTWQRATI